jgi:hypothetical protein
MTGASKDTIKEGFTAMNQIITDLASTASGKGASCIGIYDSANNFAAENVETALAEVYTDHAAALTMSAVFDENTATTTGLTWGYKGGQFRNDNTITTVTAGTVSLTDDTTNYIEVASNGTVYVVAGSFTAGRIPIRTVVTASGVQTTSTDKRAWFSTWPTAYYHHVNNLKVTRNATTNILDLFESTTGVDPTTTYPIRIAIPNGTGVTWRTRSAAVVSGTGSFTLADGTGYWGLPSSNGSDYEVYVYAIWSTADSGIVWGMSNRSDYQLCPTGTTNTADGYMLLEDSSTYTRAGTDYCVAVARVRFEYDTGDAPDYTFSTSNITLIYGNYSDAVLRYTRFKVIAATRAMDAATGDVNYAHGLGITPKAVFAIGAVSTKGASIGYAVGTAAGDHGSVVSSVSAQQKLIYAYEDAGKSQDAVVKTLDPTNITLTWTRTGATASATFTFYMLAAG